MEKEGGGGKGEVLFPCRGKINTNQKRGGCKLTRSLERRVTVRGGRKEE